jgi:putative glutamine amidotransferase
MPPLIGINLNFDVRLKRYTLSPDYVRAVERAGGIPVPLPAFSSIGSVKEVVKRLDGVVFTGGRDIDPKRYGQRPHPKTQLLDPEKEKTDEIIMNLSLDMGKDILAICYGCQLLNVALGGTLHQHLPDLQLGPAHRREGRSHGVRLSGRLKEIYKQEEIKVNSYHHQGIDRVGRDLKVVAVADDGLVEGISLDNGFVLGVQWHPEMMHKDKLQQALFKAFVKSC